MAALARAWQMLLKGLDEVGRAPRSMTAAGNAADPDVPCRRSASA